MNEIVNQQKRIVQYRVSTCLAYCFCSHAIPHKERENCYNHEPEKRMADYGRQYIVCPECYPLEENNGLQIFGGFTTLRYGTGRMSGLPSEISIEAAARSFSTIRKCELQDISTLP